MRVEFSLVEFFPQKGRPLNRTAFSRRRQGKKQNSFFYLSYFLKSVFVVAATGKTTWPWLPGANTWSNDDDFHPEKNRS
jgi:hypothetical protein